MTYSNDGDIELKRAALEASKEALAKFDYAEARLKALEAINRQPYHGSISSRASGILIAANEELAAAKGTP